MRATDFDLDKIVEQCRGTCMETIDDAIREHYPDMSEDDLTEADLAQIDNEIFTCNECGWWCESSEAQLDEQASDIICEDCAESHAENNAEED